MITTLQQPLVFCDVETTGGYAKRDRITEIACIRYEQGVEVARLDTLINPHQPIPFNIQLITNITNAMTDAAPDFAAVASEVAEIFDGAELVAHHSRFDHGFIKAEMERAGYEFSPPQLCTAKLSRRLYPMERRHGLSQIIERFSFTCDARHRAMGDTQVLVQFATQLEVDHTPEAIVAAIEHSKGAYTPPPNLDKQVIDELPQEPGVYTFVGEDGVILYIGKSKNIRSRVMSHFANAAKDTRSRKIWSEVQAIDYTVTNADFSAQLLEIFKIKAEMPLYNRRLRKNQRLWGLTLHAHDGYRSFDVRPLSPTTLSTQENIFAVYRTKSQAITSLEAMTREYKLCPKLMGLERGSGACFSSQLGVCSGACCGAVSELAYNFTVDEALRKQKYRIWPYQGEREIVIPSKYRDRVERFVIDNWVVTSATVIEDGEEQFFFEHAANFFDYDLYKVLLKKL